MNESAGEHVTNLLHLDLGETDTDDLDARDEPDADDEAPVRAAREGLPGGFRMRHDAHYVDELMSRTPDHDRVAPRAGDPATATAAPAPAALTLLARRLEAVAGHADAIRPDSGTPPLIARSVRVELARVTRLARAAAILETHEPPVRRALPAGEIADRAKRIGIPVARMCGIACDVSLGDPVFTVLADPALVVLGIVGTIDALLDLLHADPRRRVDDDWDDSSARIAISVHSVRIRPALLIDVSCPALLIESAHAGRFFDNAAEDYRAAPAAGILLSAAAHVARAHGGRADLKRHDGDGVTTITYVFPQ